MQHYELMIIFIPVLSDTEYKSSIAKYIKFIKKHNGQIVESESWGLKNLAYEIHKKSVGIYWLLSYKVDHKNKATFNQSLKTQLSRDESILRSMITCLDKYAVKYNEKRRTKKEESAQILEKVDTEEVVTPQHDGLEVQTTGELSDNADNSTPLKEKNPEHSTQDNS